MLVKSLLALIFVIPLCARGQDVSDCFPEPEPERRVQLDVGLGTESGINGGASWHIPVSAGGDNHLVLETALGFDPFTKGLAYAPGVSWTSINPYKPIGGSLSLLVSTKRWKDGYTEIGRGMIALAPGLLMRWGSRVVALRLGAAIGVTSRFTQTPTGEETIKQNELTAVAEVKVTFRTPW